MRKCVERAQVVLYACGWARKGFGREKNGLCLTLSPANKGNKDGTRKCENEVGEQEAWQNYK